MLPRSTLSMCQGSNYKHGCTHTCTCTTIHVVEIHLDGMAFNNIKSLYERITDLASKNYLPFEVCALNLPHGKAIDIQGLGMWLYK